MDIKLERNTILPKLLIFCIVLVLFSCIFYIYHLTTTKDKLLISRDDVIFQTIQPTLYENVLISRAIAVPNQSVIISSERGGKITKITKKAFENVQKGEVIVQLSNYDFMLEATSRMADITEQINSLRTIKIQLEQDNRDTKLRLQEAKHQIEIISKKLIRHQELDKKSMIAKSELEYQIDTLNNWKMKCNILQDHDNKNTKSLPSQFKSIDDSIFLLEGVMKTIENGMEQLVIKAPIDGTLSVLDIELGQQIKPGGKIAVIDNLDSYYLNIHFSEYYLDKIIPQSRITSRVNGQDIPLLIETVSTIIDNGKFKAKLTPIGRSTVNLKRGQSVEVRITLQEEDNHILLVPNDSIISNKKGDDFLYIYQQENDLAIKTKVEAKRRDATNTQILSGLNPGQQIVIYQKENNIDPTTIEFK
ncbi:darobactin export ABC transporter periplasmic adaptor subunit [Yersinia aldovae]|uniref:darobactin export ABC transporter periplasmic adaptor subunit n=1 Tax=Yersinia aldovae TaxID=29483 RepID=UPI0005AC769A|nr:darobactin export ABC transporter periplasmic adaptor subunit [Yersinia aldovae]AJJ64767.1 efflux transporter, RND family, MFP subunit [Yersinia aldovae 670-83]